MDKPLSIEVDDKTVEYFTHAFIHAYCGDGKEVLDTLTIEQLKVISYVSSLAHLHRVQVSK